VGIIELTNQINPISFQFLKPTNNNISITTLKHRVGPDRGNEIMADITPFKGILYNTEKIKDISEVVTPPYDVISEHEQDAFYKRNQYNVIRLDKGKPEDDDSEDNNSHTRAAGSFQEWLKEGILVEEDKPAFYLASVTYAVEGEQVTRYGLIARVKLEAFEKGIILPHEKTFSKVKTERLELIKACHANFSQIFSVFSDPSDILGLIKNSVEQIPPFFDFYDDAGHNHKLWRLTEPDLHQKIVTGFQGRRLFIADGHHRYETALNFKKWLIENNADFDDTHPANYTMMYLCSIQDPGLVILPTNRILTKVNDDLRDNFLDIAAPYFEINTVPLDSNTIQQKLRPSLIAGPGEHKFGVFIKGLDKYAILTLKPDIMNQVFGDEIEGPLKELDVIVLTRLLFVKILGFNDQMLDDHDLIHFSSKDAEAIEAVTSGKNDMAFIINPTTNDQVRKIAEKGLIMPRKSTYYFPKAISGQVMRSLSVKHNRE